MGGAGFPTCVKLKPAKPVDTILLNGCECEPLLTADHRVLLEYADDIIFGLRAVLKTTGAQKGCLLYTSYCIFSGFNTVDDRNLGRTDILTASALNTIHNIHVLHALPVLVFGIF